MKREIENAQITGISISMADYNCLTFRVTVQGACWGCSIGNYKIGTGMLGADYWDASGSGVVAMMKIMDTVGSDTWEGVNYHGAKPPWLLVSTISVIITLILAVFLKSPQAC